MKSENKGQDSEFGFEGDARGQCQWKAKNTLGRVYNIMSLPE